MVTVDVKSTRRRRRKTLAKTVGRENNGTGKGRGKRFLNFPGNSPRVREKRRKTDGYARTGFCDRVDVGKKRGISVGEKKKKGKKNRRAPVTTTAATTTTTTTAEYARDPLP